MHILLALNSKVYMLALSLITSIFLHNPEENIVIWFCYSDLTKKEISLLECFVRSLGGNCNFIFVEESVWSRFNTENYPKEAYYRIVAMDELPEDLDRILYLDVDMIVKASLKELYTMDLSGYACAACKEIYGELIDGMGIVRAKKALNIPEKYEFVNSGMLLMNLSVMRKESFGKKMMDYILHTMKDFSFPDQSAINACLYDRIKYVPWEQYNCPPMMYIYHEKEGKRCLMKYEEIELLDVIYIDDLLEMYRNAVIVHFAGTRRPWIENPGEPDAVAVFRGCYDEALRNMEDVLKQMAIK